VIFLNCLLCVSQLLYIFLNRLVPSVLLLSFLDVGEVKACGVMVSAISDVGGGVGVLNLFFGGLLDLIFWEDCSCAIIARASFCRLWHWVMEGSGCNGCVKESDIIVDGDNDGLVGDVGCVFSGHEASPVEVDVMLSLIDEGSKEVEVIVSGVGLDKDDAIVCSKSEYSGGGEPMVPKVGVLLGGLGRVGRHDGGWSSEGRVLILAGCCLNSTSNSGALRSLVLTHESWAGEYPFQQMRYCFFFQRPKVLSLRICSTCRDLLLFMASSGQRLGV